MANKAALDPYGLYLARLERKAKQKGWNIANFFRQRQEFFFFFSAAAAAAATAAREGNAINIFQKWGQPAHGRARLGGQLVQPSDRLGGMGAWLAAVAGGRWWSSCVGSKVWALRKEEVKGSQL